MKLLLAALLLLASPVVKGQDVTVRPHEYSVTANLKDQMTWTMEGDTLAFEQKDSTCLLRKKGGDVLYTWKTPLEVSGAVSSEEGKALLVVVMTSKGFYHGITRFVRRDGAWKIDEVMLGEHANLKIRDRWVRELGAVSDDGATAIFHIGEADSDLSPQRKGFRMFYGWQTWNLDKTEKIGTGLKMCNGKKG
jgi:hypothetical protein